MLTYKILAALFLFIFAVSIFQAALAGDSSSWQKLSPEIECKEFRWMSQSDRQYSVKIIAIRASARHFHVICGKHLYAKQWRLDSNAVVASNGGFFDKQHQSLGLRISRGKIVAPLLRNDWSIFTISKKGAEILTKNSIDSTKNISEAVQCSPLLVSNNHPMHLKTEFARRTAIGVEADGKVILAISVDQLSLPDWAALWSSAQGLNCSFALNLDGGPSTQLSVKTKLKSFDINGAWTVPDAIIIE